jgi:hypothetical protein
MKEFNIFSERPLQWGLRGDSYLWDDLELEFRSREIPASLEEFQKRFKVLYLQLTGSDIERAETVRLEKYGHGGMSSGSVSGSFWLNRVYPMLSERYSNWRTEYLP